MAIEKTWLAVPATPFTADGTSEGVITVASTAGFYVKQGIILRGTSLTVKLLQVKRVVSDTQLWVGPATQPIKVYSDVSTFTVSASSTIEAPEQDRPNIQERDMDRATFEEEPVVARRVIMVDQFGKKYSVENPLPISFDGTVQIGDVTITQGGNEMVVNENGSTNVETVQMFTLPYDALGATYPSATQEVYKSYVGGLAGTLQQTITVNYVDMTKALILNVVRT